MNTQAAKVPFTFWIIAIVGLLWNAFGIYNWITQTFMMDTMLESIPEEQHVLYENVPAWMSIIFAIATIVGTIACIGLILRKKWAVPLFLVSLIAIVIQMGYGMLQSESIEILGLMMGAIFPLIVILVGGFLYFYALRSQRKEWLS